MEIAIAILMLVAAASTEGGCLQRLSAAVVAGVLGYAVMSNGRGKKR